MFSFYFCHKSENKSNAGTRLLTYFFALAGFYPQYLAVRYLFVITYTSIYVNVKEGFSNIVILSKILFNMYIFFRTILVGAGFLEGNFAAIKKQAEKVLLLEPILEGVMQMFFQFIILYIIFGPGTSSFRSEQVSKYCNNTLYLLPFKLVLWTYHLYCLLQMTHFLIPISFC